MNPRKCIIEESGKVIGWACQCGLFYTAKDNADAEERAADCCVKPKYFCKTCGKPSDGYYMVECGDCAGKRLAEREQKAYDAAKKVAWKDYGGRMMNYGDTYAPDFDSEFEERDWVFGCTEEKFSIDARNLIMNELDSNGWYDDAFDDVSEEKLAELQLYLDSWCECVPISFQADESVVVLAPKREEHESECECPGCKNDLGCFRP